MHQNRFRLGLRPRPRSGSLQRSPDHLADFKGPTSKQRIGERSGGEGRGGRGARPVCLLVLTILATGLCTESGGRRRRRRRPALGLLLQLRGRQRQTTALQVLLRVTLDDPRRRLALTLRQPLTLTPGYRIPYVRYLIHFDETQSSA